MLVTTCSRLVAFSWYPSTTMKTDRHDIIEILLQMINDININFLEIRFYEYIFYYIGRLSDFSFYIDSQISVHRKFKK